MALFILLVIVTGLSLGAGALSNHLTTKSTPQRDFCEREGCLRPAALHAFGQDLCGPCAISEDRRRWP